MLRTSLVGAGVSLIEYLGGAVKLLLHFLYICRKYV